MTDPADPSGAGERPLAVLGGLDELRANHGPLFVVVGVFDGLHRGHAYLLRHLVREARRRAAQPAVITFDAHPEQVLLGAAPPLLLDPEERLWRFARAGIEVVVVLHFDEVLRLTPYDAFVESIAERSGLAGFLMTPDAAFGHERRGTPEAVGAFGAASARPFDVVVVPPFGLADRPVRSTDVRASVAAGSLDNAAVLLGRRYAVVGDRVGWTGAATGDRTTAGLAFGLPVALPPAGEYAVAVERPARSDRAAGSPRPGRLTIDAAGRVMVAARPELPPHSRLRVRFV